MAPMPIDLEPRGNVIVFSFHFGRYAGRAEASAASGSRVCSVYRDRTRRWAADPSEVWDV